VVFSPDGDRLLTVGGDGVARIWLVRTGELLCASPRHEGAVRQAHFSPDGRFVVTCDASLGALVWDARTGHALTPPLPHGAPLAAAAFAEGGKRVVTVGRHGTICGWELPGAEPGEGEVVPDDRPLAELIALAQVLACARIDERQSKVPLDVPALRLLWQRQPPR
jgi:WD40 repeat protein